VATLIRVPDFKEVSIDIKLVRIGSTKEKSEKKLNKITSH